MAEPEALICWASAQFIIPAAVESRRLFTNNTRTEKSHLRQYDSFACFPSVLVQLPMRTAPRECALDNLIQ